MRIGLIGTGNMGNPMALNLIKAGHALAVHDLQRESAENLITMGAAWSESPRELAESRELVLMSLPIPQAVEAVVLGENGVLAGARPGLVLADLSTSPPALIRRFYALGAEKGVTVLDAPVSGGVYGAAAGTLEVMVGGDRETFERLRPVFETLGNHVLYCGSSGNGMVAKLCNNLMSMGIAVLLGEALTLGLKAGVDLETLASAIGNGTGSNRRLTERFPRFLFRGNFEPGFALALARKDVGLATALGRESGVPMELGELVERLHAEAVDRGWAAEDSDAVVRLQEEKAGVQLRLL